MNKSKYLYMHVPFCKSICGYCDFVHSSYQKQNIEKWLEAIRKELVSKQISETLETIYIGGGTPTCLEDGELRSLLELLKPYSGNLREYTIEINPETLTETKADLLKEYGIDRASIGLQTSDEKLLGMMNRHHTLEDVKNCVALLKQRNIDNISLDLMYSLPNQTMDSLKRSIDDALSLQPKHLSLYSLTIEENTMFAKKGYQHLDDETEADMYEFICKTLESNGFQQYEVSNFCKEGYASIHNLAYWNYEDFIGIGVGASGKENNIRYDHTKNLRIYCEDPLHVEYIEESEDDRMFEMVMMGVRLKKGMDISLFEKRFRADFLERYGAKIDPLIQKGLVEVKDGYFYCTDRGFEIMNSILIELL